MKRLLQSSSARVLASLSPRLPPTSCARAYPPRGPGGRFLDHLVMTAMRAMQNNIESKLGELGSKTFAMQKMPGAYFGGREGLMKFFRRRDIDYPQARRFQASGGGLHSVCRVAREFRQLGSIPHRMARPAKRIHRSATPGLFQTNSWTITEGPRAARLGHRRRPRRLRARDSVAQALFSKGSPSASVSRFVPSPTRSSASSSATAGENAPGAVILSDHAGLNRYGRWAEISILVRVEDPALSRHP